MKKYGRTKITRIKYIEWIEGDDNDNAGSDNDDNDIYFSAGRRGSVTLEWFWNL